MAQEIPSDRPNVIVHSDASMLLAALALLARAAKDSPEAFERFFDGIDDPLRLARIHTESFAAMGASHTLIVFYPSELLLDFLSALGTGDRDSV